MCASTQVIGNDPAGVQEGFYEADVLPFLQTRQGEPGELMIDLSVEFEVAELTKP